MRCFAASGNIHLKRLKDAGMMAILARHHWSLLPPLGLEGPGDKELLMSDLSHHSVPAAAAGAATIRLMRTGCICFSLQMMGGRERRRWRQEDEAAEEGEGS